MENIIDLRREEEIFANVETIEDKLQKLREEWTKYPLRRRAIELRAKALKNPKQEPLPEVDPAKEAEEIFLK